MSDRAIQTAVEILADTHNRDWVHIRAGIVKSVDEDAGTCEVTIADGDNIDVPNVQLQSSVCDGLLIIPAIDSDVMLCYSTKSPYKFIVLYGDIDKVYLQVGESSLTIWNKAQSGGQEIQFNDGSYGGLITLVDTQNPDKGILARINKIEKDINTLKTAFSTWVCVPQDGGAALKAAAASWFAQQLIVTQKDDINNPLITHGK